MIDDEVRDIIERLRPEQFDPRLARTQGTYRFEVAGVGVWRVRVDRGHVTVHDGPGDADCIVRSDAAEFVRIARGEQNLLTAMMQGRLEIEGDMALAQVLHGIMPPKPATQREVTP